MKKTKRRIRRLSALMALVMVALCAMPTSAAVIPEQELSPNTNDPGYMQPLSSYETEHSYDYGIVDGAVYYLRNVYHNTYMDVDNENTADGTGISTYGFHGHLNQQFKFFYLGNGMYEIIAMNSGTNLHINPQGAATIYSKNRSIEQRYRVQMLNSTTGVIFTEFSGYSKALCFNVDHPNSVVQKTYSTLSDKTQAQWVFERMPSQPAEQYGMYYIRHYTTGHYLDVIERGTAEGTLIHGTVHFNGGINQEWKLVYDSTRGCYYLKPGHRRDMAVDDRSDALIIANDTAANTQGFWINGLTQDAATGRPLFQLKTVNQEYVTLGSSLNGGSSDYRYITTTDYAGDYWILEGVPHDAKDPGVLALNTWRSGNVEPGYLQEQPYYFTATQTARYKVEVKDGNANIGTIISETGANAEIMTRKTYNGMRVANVLFQAGVTYCIPVCSNNAVSGGTTGFSVRVRQLTAVGHSSKQEIDGNANVAAEIVLHVQQPLKNAGFYAMRFDNISASDARVGTVPITGFDHFNSEIFLYAGHGIPGYAMYNGTNKNTYLSAQQLPDMSNCELAIWANCKSAKAPLFGDSMAEKSYNNGAKTSIGWSIDIKQIHMRPYVINFIDNLLQGMTIEAASNAALSTLVNTPNLEADIVADFVKEIEYYGSKNNVIFPVASTAAQHINAYNNTVIHDVEYTLVAENNAVGWKMYARMINGIMTDDYYVEFYDGEKLVDVTKSYYTMSDAEVAVVTNQVNQFLNADAVEQTDAEADGVEYLIRCIDNEWRLVEKCVTASEACECCTENVYYDAFTREVISP